MATPVHMPRQGQSVETCLIQSWKKAAGASVKQGEVLCEVETDKATFEIEAPASGTLLKIFHPEGTDVPVLAMIAAIGTPGEDLSALLAEAGAAPGAKPEAASAAATTPAATSPATPDTQAAPAASAPAASAVEPGAVSPRARGLAQAQGLPLAGLTGSGPDGRVIERDVQSALAQRPELTAAAREAVAAGAKVPASGTALGGRVGLADLAAATAPASVPAAAVSTAAPSAAAPAASLPDEVTVLPVKGIRKLIAERMLASLQTTAQLTLNASADARAMQAYRAQLKASPEDLGLAKITLNDLLLFTIARVLPRFPELNSLYDGKEIRQYRAIHLAFAVDTPRGLMVPVLRHADRLSLKALAAEGKRLATACQSGKVTAEELNGGTFTVSNLGAFGIESFTPVLNLPQVAILGVGAIALKPVAGDDGAVTFVPHLGLSLTINHQVVDGAPASRFLQALGQALANLPLYLAL